MGFRPAVRQRQGESSWQVGRLAAKSGRSVTSDTLPSGRNLPGCYDSWSISLDADGVDKCGRRLTGL